MLKEYQEQRPEYCITPGTRSTDHPVYDRHCLILQEARAEKDVEKALKILKQIPAARNALEAMGYESAGLPSPCLGTSSFVDERGNVRSRTVVNQDCENLRIQKVLKLQNR